MCAVVELCAGCRVVEAIATYGIGRTSAIGRRRRRLATRGPDGRGRHLLQHTPLTQERLLLISARRHGRSTFFSGGVTPPPPDILLRR